MSLDDVYLDLIKVMSEFGVDISSIDAEKFFEKIVNDFSGSKDELLIFIKNNMPEWFPSLSRLPQWIQNSDWQFSDGRPMIFIGQLDIPASAGIFHDDSSFYTFWSRETDETTTIIQVA